MAGFGRDIDDHLPLAYHTFTYERVERQLNTDTFISDPESTGGHPSPFNCESLEYSHDLESHTHRFYSKAEQDDLRKLLCHSLYDAVKDPKEHCTRLDNCFSKLVLCNLQIDGEPKNIIENACDIMGRLPAIPLELPGTPPLLHAAYLVDSAPETLNPSWRGLQVVNYVAANVIRTALLAAIYRGTTTGTMLDKFVDTVADLISTSSELFSSAASDDERLKWFLVRAFLWTSWQRCSMIYLYTIVGSHIRLGFNDHDGHSLLLKGFFPSPGLSIQEMSRKGASAGKSDYMCGWAFELLRSDPSAVGLDFRRFHRRFSDAFGARPGRCIQGHQSSCQGDDLSKCQRFRGMKITNQSAHDSTCPGTCQRLFWDRSSYESISGARAVKLVDNPTQGRVTYCEASGETLAISHVWSHGQGGRPEDGHGFNHCLHRRYIAIARSLLCSSYWMDSPCIPEDHEFRKEAISKINEVFENSRATVVYDRDLTEIDAKDLSIRTRELIVVTAMICDWNLRAWTFLEAFRGRHSIYALCKDNVTVSLKETVETVYNKGSIDIALLLLSIPHLLPSRDNKNFKTIGNAFESGFMTVETAGSLLSHRSASRPGDDVVIWTLLISNTIEETLPSSPVRNLCRHDTIHEQSKAFWKRQQGRYLSTSFLLSSAPRLKTRGLRWAPSSPTAELWESPLDGTKTRLLALDGTESEGGSITKDGFMAKWLMYDFVGGLIGARAVSSFIKVEVDPVDDRCQVNLRRIRQRYLRGFLWGAILRPVDSRKYGDPAPSRSDQKSLVVVCATNKRCTCPFSQDDRIFWTWRGVYEWDTREPLPNLMLTSEVLIV